MPRRSFFTPEEREFLRTAKRPKRQRAEDPAPTPERDTPEQLERLRAASRRADAILARVHRHRLSHEPERSTFRRLADLLRARGVDPQALAELDEDES